MTPQPAFGLRTVAGKVYGGPFKPGELGLPGRGGRSSPSVAAFLKGTCESPRREPPAT